MARPKKNAPTLDVEERLIAAHQNVSLVATVLFANLQAWRDGDAEVDEYALTQATEAALAVAVNVVKDLADLHGELPFPLSQWHEDQPQADLVASVKHWAAKFPLPGKKRKKARR